MSTDMEQMNELKAEIYDTNKRAEQLRADIAIFVERIAATIGVTPENGQFRLDAILQKLVHDYAKPAELIEKEPKKRGGKK